MSARDRSGGGDARWPPQPPRLGPDDGFTPGHLLSEAVGDYLQTQGLGELTSFARVLGCWREVVGVDVASHARPEALREGELAVAVDDGAWATEFRFLSKEVLAGLSARVGAGIVLGLKVHVRG